MQHWPYRYEKGSFTIEKQCATDPSKERLRKVRAEKRLPTVFFLRCSREKEPGSRKESRDEGGTSMNGEDGRSITSGL